MVKYQESSRASHRSTLHFPIIEFVDKLYIPLSEDQENIHKQRKAKLTGYGMAFYHVFG